MGIKLFKKRKNKLATAFFPKSFRISIKKSPQILTKKKKQRRVGHKILLKKSPPLSSLYKKKKIWEEKKKYPDLLLHKVWGNITKLGGKQKLYKKKYGNQLADFSQ